MHVYFEKEETVEQRSNIVLEPALLIFLPTPKHTEHRSSPFPTTPHHSSPLPTTPRHSSPLLTTPHHSSPFLTTPTSIGAKWLLYLTVPKWVPLAPIGAPSSDVGRGGTAFSWSEWAPHEREHECIPRAEMLRATVVVVTILARLARLCGSTYLESSWALL